MNVSYIISEINSYLPDNTEGLITPEVLRTTLIDTVNGMNIIDAERIWTGTEEEYEEIDPKDPSTIYIVTEE